MTAARAASAQSDAQEIDNAVDNKLLGVYRRLDELGNRSEMQTAMMQDLTASVKEISERLRKFETENIGLLTALQQQMSNAFTRIDETKQDLVDAKNEHQKDIDKLDAEVKGIKEKIPEDLKDRIQALEKVIPSIALNNKILITIGGLFLASIITLIWALITGQATVTFH
jgi:DNA repair exonuclease SbcCD ATPase subunit